MDDKTKAEVRKRMAEIAQMIKDRKAKEREV